MFGFLFLESNPSFLKPGMAQPGQPGYISHTVTCLSKKILQNWWKKSAGFCRNSIHVSTVLSAKQIWTMVFVRNPTAYCYRLTIQQCPHFQITRALKPCGKWKPNFIWDLAMVQQVCSSDCNYSSRIAAGKKVSRNDNLSQISHAEPALSSC